MRNLVTPEQSWKPDLSRASTLLTALIIFCSIEGTLQAQVYPEATEEAYSESTLRRFEVIFLVSLPFTTVHSYLAVKGIRTIEKGTIAAELSDTDYKIMGVSAVAFSLFIGFWDWIHTHDKSPSQPKMPSPRDKGENREAKSVEIEQRITSTSLSPFPFQKGGRSSTSQGCFVPLLQVKF